MTKAQQAWKNAVAEMGCIICGEPAELHHPREGVGMGQRASDFLVIPLCPLHHRLGTQFHAPSVHGAPQHFRAKYGSEMELLGRVNQHMASML